MNSLSSRHHSGVRSLSGFGTGFRALVLGVVLAGCAAVAPGPEQAVRERAQARWDALLKGETKVAYGYLSPGSRAVLKLEDYDSSISKGFWKSARVDEVVCQGVERCEARLTIEYEFQRMRTKTPLRETWIREGSDWWYVAR